MESPDLSVVELNSGTSSKLAAKSQYLPLVLCWLFLVSGSSGLIYEVVWLRMLSRTLGSTVYAASTILAVFMGGLALGSFLFGRIADRVRRPLVFYAILEACIGATALLSLGLNSWPIPLYREIYSFANGSRAALTFGQVLLAMLALIIPTTLMGATLPTLCAYGVRRTGSMGRVVGTLYSLNTLGALAGVLVGGFYLIGAIGETRTVLVGFSINVLVAIVALTLLPTASASLAPRSEPLSDPPLIPTGKSASPVVRRAVLACFGVSGFVSLGLEIAWNRILPLYEGTSIYAFSAMLAAMLAGIGLGGWLGAYRVDRLKDPLLALARLELGVGLAAVLGLAGLAFIDQGSLLEAPIVMVGPAALLLGIAFPVAVRCYADHARSLGRRVGELYAWNTVGCILGSLAGGFLLVPHFGAARAGTMLAGLASVSGLALFMVHPKSIRRARLGDISMLIATIVCMAAVGDPYQDVIYSRIHLMYHEMEIFAHVDEAAASTTAAGVPHRPLERHLLINGTGMTALVTGNKLMADLPLWMSDSPHDALVICMGMGTTFRSATRHRDVNVTVVELVPAVTRFMHYFHTDANQVIAQPNAHIVVDDGRNYLLMHPRLVDVITLDPAPPIFSAGTVNLYSREFFELCAHRIRPTGAVCLWVQPAQMSEVKMILHTYATVFPYISVWSGPTFPGFLLVGTLRPVNDVEARVRRGFEDPVTVADLTEWDKSCQTADKVLALRVCGRDALLAYTENRPIITDDHPYTEFPLWRYLLHDSEYAQMVDAEDLRRWISTTYDKKSPAKNGADN